MFRSMPISAIIGLAGLGFYLFLAFFAQVIAHYGVAEVVGGVWEPPSAAYWLGTDNLGRDLLSRLIYGAQITILVATAAAYLVLALRAVLVFCSAFLHCLA